MGLWGAAIGAVVGGVVGAVRSGANNKHRDKMIAEYDRILKKGGKKNVKEQNALLANLAALKGDESASGKAEMAASDASKMLRAKEGEGVMGTREGMFSGEGAARAAQYASDANQENLGRYAAQADIQDQQARYLQAFKAIQAAAKKQRDKEKDAKTSGVWSAIKTGAAGAQTGASLPI